MEQYIEYENGQKVSLDNDDVPELGEDFFKKAKHHSQISSDVTNAVNNTRAGRPLIANPKKPISIRLDTDVIDWLKAQGSGYQCRINDILRDAMNK